MRQVYISDSNDPYYNQLLEHYFFYEYHESVLFLYVNSPCVVIGRHQNPWQEINLNALNDKRIPFVRRLSGGGTVYHDMGNVNFAFFYNEGESSVDENFELIVSRMNDLGIELSRSERNDLLHQENKVSGNAFYRRGKRRLHHGTLLIDSDLTDLWSVLRFDHEGFSDKSVKSFRSSVVNLAHVYDVTIDKVIDTLSKDMLRLDSISVPQAMDQYISYDWLYGETPRFKYSTSGYEFLVKDGYIVESDIKTLINNRFDMDEIQKKVKER